MGIAYLDQSTVCEVNRRVHAPDRPPISRFPGSAQAPSRARSGPSAGVPLTAPSTPGESPLRPGGRPSGSVSRTPSNIAMLLIHGVQAGHDTTSQMDEQWVGR
jgi:hypothetical protein